MLVLVEGRFLKTHTRGQTHRRIDPAALELGLRVNIRHNPSVLEMAVLSGLSASRFRAVFLLNKVSRRADSLWRFAN